jgi:diguanylate cyclase (GGDEF)-like protein
MVFSGRADAAWAPEPVSESVASIARVTRPARMPIESTLDASAWNPLVALVFCTALLWVGAAVAWEATAPGAMRTRSLDFMSIVLVTAGLWWPAQLATSFHAGEGLFVVALMVTLAAGAAFMARLGVLARWHHPQQLLGSGGVLMGCLALVAVVYSLPGSGLPWSPLALMAAAVILACALRALHRPLRSMPARLALRSASALLAAGVLSAVSWRSSAPGTALDANLVPMAALTAMGGFLAVSLRQVRRQRRAERMNAAPTLDLDVLTALPNRSAIESRLTQAVARCDGERRRLALLIVNLDGFKPVNATYGHVIGDQVLKQASRRMRRLMQPKDMLARLGGDAFAVLLTHHTEREPLARLAERLIDAIGQPYRLGTKEVQLTCSVGIALYPDHGDAERLIARAETAVQTAKRAGGARADVFTADMDEDMTQDLELLRDLRQALDNDGLALVFQPKIDAASGRITAAEALLRWRHPERGDVPPTTFVALAERFGLVTRLGDWVIERACLTAGQWAQRGVNMRVAINLSAQHLREPGLAQRIGQALTRNRIEASRLTCEITETLAMENTQATQATLAQLGLLGVHLSIDDFGTGYSSLAYLRQLPAKEIKIDRSFVLDLERSGDARAVVDGVVKLAHALGKRVVAEGVETVKQRRILTELGCDELQGYLFAQPMAADDLLQWALDARNNDEDAFRSSLYVHPGDVDPRLRRSTRPPISTH